MELVAGVEDVMGMQMRGTKEMAQVSEDDEDVDAAEGGVLGGKDRERGGAWRGPRGK